MESGLHQRCVWGGAGSSGWACWSSSRVGCGGWVQDGEGDGSGSGKRHSLVLISSHHHQVPTHVFPPPRATVFQPNQTTQATRHPDFQVGSLTRTRLHVGSMLTSIIPDFMSEAMAQISPQTPHPHSVNLLRNCNLRSPLGPFDGNVATHAQIGAQHFLITTNADYVPAVPSLEVPHTVYLRADMHYGMDDPTLWPQQWTAHYCHLPLIAKKGAHPELEVMWWNPTPEDFRVGSAVTRGLGRLMRARFSRFLPAINELVPRCRELHHTSPAIALPLFGQLIQQILMYLEQLQTLPTTYTKMLFAVTPLQRAFLKLDALYNYMTIYKERMNNYMAPTDTNTAVGEFVSVFTSVPTVAQQLWAAHIPFWFLRGYEVFDAENILAVVPLRQPTFDLPDPDAHGEGAPPALYSGNSTLDKIAAIDRAARETPWYHDPFETSFARPPPPSPAPAADAVTPVASTSCPVAPHVVPVQPGSQITSSNRVINHIQPKLRQKSPAKTPAAAKPPKIEPDKFIILQVIEMLPSIVCMADALAKLLSAQEWRDILDDRARRSSKLEERIRPALQASNVASIEGFPVPIERLPQFSLEQTREIIWQVAETNFRFEFCALDRRASGKNRLDDAICWLGAIGDDIAHARLDDQVSSPEIIGRVAGRFNWSPSDIQSLETAVSRYYTQAFWEYFGHTAVVPMHLEHELEKEGGEI
ncbi:hypothetical protein B0H17DRAFT_1145389 [Mycena rosella]|uniref:Uncharacterized protein n=1 Tax=Mycena rosella TaxID=1033263 RepID=A0AAD7CRC7_MYCRO|nr:hypothetical protein B0H17DRAFT_1145389 [Mycena rosella]